MSIKAVEQHLVDRIKARLGSTVREVDSLPDQWTADTFKRLFHAAPGAYVVFGGGPAIDDEPRIRSRWAVVCVTAHAGDEKARRHGDAREIGAYEMVEIVATLLHDHVVPDAGAMKLVDIENLFQGQVEQQGGTLYGAAFELPMTLDPEEADAALATFLRFDADFDLAPADDAFEASDTVTLPQ